MSATTIEFDIVRLRTALKEEFGKLWAGHGQAVPAQTEAIVYLIGAGERCPEDVSRMAHTRRIFYQITAKNDEPPLVVLSGEDEEFENMRDMAIDAGLPPALLHLQSCGVKGKANTKTQFEALRADPVTSRFMDVALITSTYHVPRVVRTAGRFLSSRARFVVTSDLNDTSLYDPAEKEAAETRRIIEYATKGDILAYPRF